VLKQAQSHKRREKLGGGLKRKFSFTGGQECFHERAYAALYRMNSLRQTLRRIAPARAGSVLLVDPEIGSGSGFISAARSGDHSLEDYTVPADSVSTGAAEKFAPVLRDCPAGFAPPRYQAARTWPAKWPAP